MADQLKTARLTGATLASDTPARIGELEAAISAITGIPLDVLITNPMHEVVAAGLRKIFLQDLAGDPAATGQLVRNALDLKWHDNIGARTLWHTGSLSTKHKLNNQNVLNQTSLQNDVDLKFDGTQQVPAGFYEFEMQVFFQSPSAAGLKIGLNVTIGATGVWTCLFNTAGVATFRVLATQADPINIPSDGTIQATWIKGTINYPATGVFQFQFAQTTSNGGGTGIVAGSTLTLRKMG